MKKATRIEYNPYTNTVSFQISLSVDGPWESLADNSSLLHFTNEKILFSNCVADFVSEINDKHNTSDDGLEIQFSGTNYDFELLKYYVNKVNVASNKQGKLSCVQIARYTDADEALAIIKKEYQSISDEFSDYLPGQDKYEEDKTIGDSIVKFDKTIDDEIPICVIGNYSVGKSAFINALIGAEILPSKENPSTAKNVKVVRSEKCKLTFDYIGDVNNAKKVSVIVYDGGFDIETELDKTDKDLIDKSLKARIESINETKEIIIHDILDYFNEIEKTDLFLSRIGWNIVIEVPFANSILSTSNSKIVIYDTPGSNNSEIDQVAHREALIKMMSSQTNALPILVTTRETLAANDTHEIKNLLDNYYDNFVNPNCLVVISKGDVLNQTQLKEPIPGALKKWHGNSTVLFASPVGALGDKKNTEKWFDTSYQEIYETWKDRLNNEKRRVVLPDYNIVPCEGRKITEIENSVSDSLFATGIPTVENEILYYIDNFANYKKCARGSADLLSAMNRVNEELAGLERQAQKAKQEADRKKTELKNKLIREIDMISLRYSKSEEDAIFRKFQPLLEEYCDSLETTIKEQYDNIFKDGCKDLDEELDRRLREHCQRELIEKSYQGDAGIRNEIDIYIKNVAKLFSSELVERLNGDSEYFTDETKEKIDEYINSDNAMPLLKPITNSFGEIIEKINDLVAKLKMDIQKRITKNDEKAVTDWLDSKRKNFIKKLTGEKNIFVANKEGWYKMSVMDEPIKKYKEQLEKWAFNYRNNIKNLLDSENALLSGLESEILKIESQIDNFKNRICALKGVEEELKAIVEKQNL